MHKILIATLAFVASLPVAARAGETLMVNIPDSYHLDYSVQQGQLKLQEFVPIGETVDNWTHIVTLLVHIGGLDITLPGYEDFMRGEFHNPQCEGPGYEPLENGALNGYPFRSFRLNCTLLTSTGQPEWTLFKVIEGNDSLYVVQKAFRYTPGTAEQAEWHGIVHDRALVCDTRIAGRGCPDWSD